MGTSSTGLSDFLGTLCAALPPYCLVWQLLTCVTRVRWLAIVCSGWGMAWGEGVAVLCVDGQ